MHCWAPVDTSRYGEPVSTRWQSPGVVDTGGQQQAAGTSEHHQSPVGTIGQWAPLSIGQWVPPGTGHPYQALAGTGHYRAAGSTGHCASLLDTGHHWATAGSEHQHAKGSTGYSWEPSGTTRHCATWDTRQRVPLGSWHHWALNQFSEGL